MPQIGDIKAREQVGGKGSSRVIWWACIDCKKERWTNCVAGKATTLRCHTCNNRHFFGRQHGAWKGGKRHSDGYVLIWLDPNDFFYPMAGKRGYVLEHRLVVAKALNRCLLPWEVVHHKNGIRDDNRFTNLKLLPHPRFHLVDTVTKSYIARLEQRIKELEEV